MRGAVRSPTTRAPRSSSTASLARTSPCTAPETVMCVPDTLPRTAASSPSTSSPLTLTSPSTRPRISRLPEPRTLPRTTLVRPITEEPFMQQPPLYVHVDVALERGTVGDRQARGFHVADQAAAGLEVHALGRGHVARHLACDGEALGGHVGLDHGRAAHRHGVARAELAAQIA